MTKLSWRLLFLFCLFLVTRSISAQNNFSIYGSLPNKYNGIEINLSSDNVKFIHIVTKARNGKFNFSGKLDQQYEHVYLSVSQEGKVLGYCSFFIQQGKMKVEILNLKENLGNEIRWSNVPFIEQQKTYDSLMKPIRDSVTYAFNLLSSINTGYQVNYDNDSLLKIVTDLRTVEVTRKVQFIKSFPNHYIALYVFNKDILNNISANIRIDIDSLLAIYSGFNKTLKESSLGQFAFATIRKRQSLQLNRIMPDFPFTTNKNEHYNLSDFRNRKYVLLCFWDSWCKACIESFPLMKNLASRYLEKDLELISVSMDNNETKWLNSLKRYDLPWLQTCDLPSFIKGAKVRSLYDIDYIPQYFLLDKEGRLIYHNTYLKDDDQYTILRKVLENVMK